MFRHARRFAPTGWLTAGLGGLIILMGGSSLFAAEPGARSKCFALTHALSEPSADTARHPRWTRRFDVYETSAIELDVHCIRPPSSDLRVRLRLPNGDVYETLQATATSEPAGPGRRRARRMALLATARLPVTGSFITQYGLLGSWSAQVCWMEGQRETCGRALDFSLER